ncbi:MAG: alpha/beta hydrolase [Candidatus Aminicenantes bacterium]|jgi:pimeloyl-ACP methyl ester carboxylesterase
MKKYIIFFCITIVIFFTLCCTGQQDKEEAVIADNYIPSADGVSIHYQVQGQGSPALVFIHGWCCDLTFWEKQMAPFAERYRIVAVDLAGHGKSGLDRKSWTIAAFGEDVVAVVNKLDLDQVVLIGHSMGGLVILEAARRIPDHVVGLVGVDTLNNLDEEVTHEQFEEMISPLRDDFAESTKNFVRTMFAPDSDPALVEKIVRDMSSAPSEVGIASFEANFDYWADELQTAVRAVKAPLTCINSDRYPSNPEGNKKYNPHYELKIMPGLGHFVMLEDPEAFNHILDETIQEFIRAPYPIANPKDVSSIDSLIDALYESITFPLGGEPNLDRFRSLFTPNAPFVRITPDGPNVMDLESFISSFDERIRSGALKSFYETEKARKFLFYGGIAHVFSIYQKGMNTNEPQSLGRGINSIQLFFDGERWWACSITWQDESPGNPIPTEYLQ